MASNRDNVVEEVLALYRAQPYPADSRLLKTEGAPLPPLEWINAVVSPRDPVTGPKKSILVAGCGTGAEALRYATACPQASVVGIDFSPRSIDIAQRVAAEEGHPNLTFARMDLIDDRVADQWEPFNFISLHGVADYIPDAAAAFRTLSRALKPEGCLYLGLNGPAHPSVRYKRALALFGLSVGQTEASAEDRVALRAIERLMGPDGKDSVAEASNAYLASDIFARQNHSQSIGHWLDCTQSAGLHLLTSLDNLALLPSAEPEVLRQYLPFTRPELTRLACEVQLKSFMRLLFVKTVPEEPPWNDVQSLTNWYPWMDQSRRENIRHVPGEWEDLTPISMTLPGFGNQRIFLSPAARELLHGCDGTRTALEIQAELPQPANWDTLRLPLFACFQAGLLHWYPVPIASDYDEGNPSEGKFSAKRKRAKKEKRKK